MAYIERQLKELTGRPLRPGTVDHVCVQHDHWCLMLHGVDSCNCRPDMLLLTEGGKRYEIDADGNLITPRHGLKCSHGFEH